MLQVESHSFSVADSVNFMNSICGIMHVLFSHPSILRLENSGGACIFVLQEVFCSLLGPSCFMMFSEVIKLQRSRFLTSPVGVNVLVFVVGLVAL